MTPEETAKHLRRKLKQHGRCDTWVSTRVFKQDLRKLLDHYDRLVELESSFILKHHADDEDNQ